MQEGGPRKYSLIDLEKPLHRRREEEKVIMQNILSIIMTGKLLFGVVSSFLPLYPFDEAFLFYSWVKICSSKEAGSITLDPKLVANALTFH